jgi:hypothetical protein
MRHPQAVLLKHLGWTIETRQAQRNPEGKGRRRGTHLYQFNEDWRTVDIFKYSDAFSTGPTT